MGAPGDVEGRQPVQRVGPPGAGATQDGARRRPGEVGGPADTDGVRRTKTGWRRILPGGDEGGRSKGGRDVSDRYRGRTTRQRNVAEKVAREWAERRAAAEVREQAIDLTPAPPRPRSSCSIRRPGRRDGERRRARRPARPAPRPPAAARRPALEGRPPRPGPRRRCRGSSTRPARSPRSASASDGGRGAGDARPPRRPDVGAARREVVPRGGARPRARRGAARAGSRGTPRSATASRRSSARGSATRRSSPCSSRGRRSPTSAASSSPDETAARVAALAAWRAGTARVLVASVQALLQATLAPDDLPGRAPDAQAGTRIGMDALLARAVRARLRAGPRGRGPRRVRAPRRHRRRVPAVAALPMRIEFFGDEIDSPARLRPTDQRSRRDGRATLTLLPATEFLLPPGGADEIRARLGRLASRLPERLALDLARFGGRGDGPGAPGRQAPPAGRSPPATRRRSGPRIVAPSTGLDHLDTRHAASSSTSRATSPTPREFLWRQAEERHAELVEQGELPRDWPSAYLPARDWKASPPRRADAGAHLAVRGGRRRRAWRTRRRASPRATCSAGASPSCRRAGRSGSSTASSTGSARRRASSSRRDQAPRLAELLGEAGHPVGDRRRGSRRRRHPGRSRSSTAASTAGSRAGRTGWRSSPTASCSAASASGGPRRCAGSCRATSSSG